MTINISKEIEKDIKDMGDYLNMDEVETVRKALTILKFLIKEDRIGNKVRVINENKMMTTILYLD